MGSLKHIFHKQIVVMLVLWLAIPACEAGSAIAQDGQQSSQSSSAAVAENALPNSPQTSGQDPQAAAPQPGAAQSQDKSARPVGTAAAPYERTMGIAATRPAGAAIAPAKQRRVRTIVISVGVILGAAAAVGSVAALSHGSPSRP